MRQIDVLVIGQGLAGSLLAWALLQQNYKILVVDPGRQNASQVAAGLINPMTGQRLVKSRYLDVLLPVALDCYRQLGDFFRQQFYVHLPMLRILKNQRELDYARQRLYQAEYQEYLEDWLPEAEGVFTEFGVLQQCRTGYLRTCLLLDSLREFFITQSCYLQTTADYQEIVLQPELCWRNFKPKHIVFCEGHSATANPWFSGLPFQLAKGQILECEGVATGSRQILNYGYWMIPLAGHRFKTGASFEPQFDNVLPEIEQAESMLSALYTVMPGLKPVTIARHQAGIRPATKDKQPFIGTHPQYANLHIFNGFGAKGSLSIPWYSREFIKHLQQQQTLPSHCDIRRYYSDAFIA